MAPEFQEHWTDEKVDVWSIGVLTFLMITGEYPFDLDEYFSDQLNYKIFHKEKLK